MSRLKKGLLSALVLGGVWPCIALLAEEPAPVPVYAAPLPPGGASEESAPLPPGGAAEEPKKEEGTAAEPKLAAPESKAEEAKPEAPAAPEVKSEEAKPAAPAAPEVKSEEAKPEAPAAPEVKSEEAKPAAPAAPEVKSEEAKPEAPKSEPEEAKAEPAPAVEKVAEPVKAAPRSLSPYGAAGADEGYVETRVYGAGAVSAKPDEPVNQGGDIWFQRGIGKFPNGPLAGKRNARAAAATPLGWAGRTPAIPSDVTGSDFYPVEDRWRIGLPDWDRWVRGLPCDPYHQNVLKGDYPILGTQCLFFTYTGVFDSFFESRRLPAAAVDGSVDQKQFKQTILQSFDLFQGDNSFHPSEWFLRLTPAWQLTDANFVDDSSFQDSALQEGFIDVQLAILSDYYDQINLRVGRQAFNADFRGFLFVDTNDAVRLFGNATENRYQYNLFGFFPVQKDPTSNFNTFDTRQQYILGGNIIRQDPGDLYGIGSFLGLNVLAGMVWNHDDFDNQLDSVSFELAAEGHIGRFNISTAFIQVAGHDSLNEIANRDVDINAQFFAIELAYPMDWIVPKLSFLYASGDDNPNDGTGTGFDSIFDNPNFAGAAFSFAQREALAPGGIKLDNANSFYPNLRNKLAQSSNFVNPGLIILNAGFDAKVTSRVNWLFNVNYYILPHSEVLDQLAQKLATPVQDVGNHMGGEISTGIFFKPLIIDNLVFTFGGSAFFPGETIKDLTNDSRTLYTVFSAVTTIY